MKKLIKKINHAKNKRNKVKHIYYKRCENCNEKIKDTFSVIMESSFCKNCYENIFNDLSREIPLFRAMKNIMNMPRFF